MPGRRLLILRHRDHVVLVFTQGKDSAAGTLSADPGVWKEFVLGHEEPGLETRK